MGLFIIFVAVLVISIILVVIGDRNKIDGLLLTSIMTTVIGSFGVFVTVLTALIINCNPNKTIVYQKLEDTREALIMRLEGNGGIIASYADYEAAVDYNSTIRTEKLNYDNFFLNWYANPLVAENLDYIDISQYPINYNI